LLSNDGPIGAQVTRFETSLTAFAPISRRSAAARASPLADCLLFSLRASSIDAEHFGMGSERTGGYPV
ncbi:hypothetical protein, partial [Aquidulcibacter paucihalophilus]|uniref:hypothetical protein n=1 Tax=Aquidulcibacter paucihalophilus TaxID=1978549 RepID=UPI001E5EE412